jgi:superfamily II DNA or RNA helicase
VAPQPHDVQQAALAALAATRAAGRRRGLVVLATGLGKTLLAAFEARALAARRVLFVAHRVEILEQARAAFERALPGRSAGMFTGDRRDRDADLMFATVQALGRPEHLASWPRDAFDLVVVDETHHVAAPSYRRLVERFTPRFLLGLTATPERADGADLLRFYDDNLVFRAGLVEGVARGLLVPFAYHGLRDHVDYAAIPWRSGGFDPDALTRALATREHAREALAGLRRVAPGARRTLWFCASIAHAEFMAGFLRGEGTAAAAVHSGVDAASRRASLRALADGEVAALTAVDVLNEGVDVPDVDSVVLLRPTDSRVVFLQQIGRGLRLPARSDKRELTIVDFIGNHRGFLAKPRALLAALGLPLPTGAAVRALREGALALPGGCSVRLETEVVDLLARLANEDRGDAVMHAYLRLRGELGRRPTLRELVAADVQVGAPAAEFGSWWHLLDRLGDLAEDERRVLAARASEWAALERVVGLEPGPWRGLQAWIELGGVSGPVADQALRAATERAGRDAVPAARVAGLWSGAVLRGDALALRTPAAPGDAPALEDMLDEVASARTYAGERRRAASDGVPMKLIRNEAGAILTFTRTPEVPSGDTEVWIEGEPHTLRFVKIAVNVARARPGGPNVLAAILAGWFGEDAGRPGLDHRVVLRREDGRFVLAPARASAGPTALPYAEALAVACGRGDADEPRTIVVDAPVPVDPRRHFVARVTGAAMDGGRTPIRDGDLALFVRLASASLESVAGKACLVAFRRDVREATLAVPVRVGDGWALRGWASGRPERPIDAEDDVVVVARFVAVVQPA